MGGCVGGGGCRGGGEGQGATHGDGCCQGRGLYAGKLWKQKKEESPSNYITETQLVKYRPTSLPWPLNLRKTKKTWITREKKTKSVFKIEKVIPKLAKRPPKGPKLQSQQHSLDFSRLFAVILHRFTPSPLS
jgi:hypothetical protein